MTFLRRFGVLLIGAVLSIGALVEDLVRAIAETSAANGSYVPLKSMWDVAAE